MLSAYDLTRNEIRFTIQASRSARTPLADVFRILLEVADQCTDRFLQLFPFDDHVDHAVIQRMSSAR